MNPKNISLVSLLFGVGLMAGCASTPPEPLPVSPAAKMSAISARPKVPPVAGSYSSRSISGDYAGYPALTRFIDHMVERHGFSREYLNGLFSHVERKDWTLNYLRRQPGYRPAPGGWSRYRAKFLTQRHISGGASFWHRHAGAVEQASTRYGVPPEYILGIIGVETAYGDYFGSHRVIDALTTLAFDYPPRANYFQGELENFLLMARDEGMDPLRPIGSYAGAMGLGQFMPTSVRRWAVDFNDDGRRDLWNPVDAIGSVANYLAEHGWRPGEPVVTTAFADDLRAGGLSSGFDTRYSLDTLLRHGIRPAGNCPDKDHLRLLRLSTYAGDQYCLGHRNFYVITRYNHSTHYAMAVHELAQAVKQRYLRTVAALR